MSRQTIKLLLMLVIGCFVAATASMSMLIVTRQEALRDAARYNTSWLASQAVAEFTRLEQRISAFGAPDGGVDKDEVELRFDILVNRVQLLSDGEFQDFIARDPEHREILDQLAAAVAAAEHGQLAAEALQHHFGRVAVIARLVGPFARLDLAFEIDLRALP